MSLLHRDKTKVGPLEEDQNSTAGSEADSDGGSQISNTASSHRSFAGLRSSRPNKKVSSGTQNNTETLTPPVLNEPQVEEAMALEVESVGSTIEASVKMFKAFEALRSSDEAAINQILLDTSKNPLDGTSVLHLAIQCADPEVVGRILKFLSAGSGSPSNLNEQDREGNTPLHLAVMLGRPSIVKRLLQEKTINDSMTNYQGQTPIELARTPDIFQMLQLARSILLDKKVKQIQVLLDNVDYDGLEKLLEGSHVEGSIDANSPELVTDPSTVQSGGTLLHQAARNRDLRLIQLLLLNGADPFRRDRGGKLPQDVTKDEKTRNILKKSPAATAAQRGIQEKAILGSSAYQSRDTVPGGKDSREMKGYLKKWTNYTSGYKLRWFVLEDGVLSYYKHQGSRFLRCLLDCSLIWVPRRCWFCVSRGHQYAHHKVTYGSPG